tara:strand:+ start:1264 stop:2220 length:957 start_codon:yes stop_codon:yes gene_type:complete
MLSRRALRIRVLQLLYSYEKTYRHADSHQNYSEKVFSDLEKSIDLIYPLYFEILTIPIHFLNLNKIDRQVSKELIVKKSNSKYNLSINQIIKYIKKNKMLSQQFTNYDLDVSSTNDDIKVWYKSLLKNDEIIKYNNLIKSDFKNDLKIFTYICLNFIFKNEEINKHFLEKDLFWDEDKLIVKSMIKKSLISLNSIKLDKFAIADLSNDLSDDKFFANNLFKGVLDGNKTFDILISENCQNWDLERISTIDRILLKMGIYEFLYFHDIPIKVTINEYIDIAKKYSTPKSKNFINGVLDILSKKMVDKINKTGKGLIDNK